MQNLYESVAPDKRLIDNGIDEKYKWLSRIHVAFKRATTGDDDPEDDMREKTREIVNENVDIEQVKDGFPTYKLNGEYLEEIEDLDSPGVTASQIAHANRDHLQPRENQNPRYKQLSERVTDIIERWHGGEIGDPEAVEALRSVEEDVLNVEDEREEQGLKPAEFAIYTHFTEEIPDTLDSEEQVRAVTTEIVSRFENEVDRSFAGWKTNETTMSTITKIQFDTLLKEYDFSHLLRGDDDVQDTIRDYLLENYE